MRQLSLALFFCLCGTSAVSTGAMFNLDLNSEKAEKHDKNELKRQEFATAWLKKWAYLGPLYENERRYRRLVDIAKDKLIEAKQNEHRQWYEIFWKSEDSTDVKTAAHVLADYQRELMTAREQIEDYYRGEGRTALSP